MKTVLLIGLGRFGRHLAILLEKGHIIASGDVDTVAAVYEEKSGKKK